jgi:hypothetical protein
MTRALGVHERACQKAGGNVQVLAHDRQAVRPHHAAKRFLRSSQRGIPNSIRAKTLRQEGFPSHFCGQY